MIFNPMRELLARKLKDVAVCFIIPHKRKEGETTPLHDSACLVVPYLIPYIFCFPQGYTVVTTVYCSFLGATHFPVRLTGNFHYGALPTLKRVAL